MSDLCQLNVPGISARLNAAVRRRMRQDGRSRNDVVVSLLAEVYGVPFTENGRHSTSAAKNPPEWHLKMPVELRKAINRDKVDRDMQSARDVVVELLSDRFGVPFVPVKHTERRRASWKREAA